MFKQQEELRMDKTKCIPKNWGVVKLGEKCEITMGQSPPSESYNTEGKGMPFLQGKQEFGSNHPVNVKYTTKPLKIAFENSILISVRAPVGDVNIADKTYCIGRGLASLRAKKGIIALFLYYLMAFQKSDVEAIGEGSTFQAITKSQIFNFKVLLPPLPEQRKIAEILETIDNAIEKTDAIIEKYKRIKQGLMQDLLTKGVVCEGEGESERWRLRNENIDKFKDSPLGKIPEEWEVVDVYGHVNLINGGTPSTEGPSFGMEVYLGYL
ncbi:type I restriction modification DNA specificity protein [Caldicellulosiruptor bescii]|nr:restriction endonuclease subunit S [Caldicellulosiruptor bescii]PBC87393.1 type I restriction modification DNA specificity protein [Caldicellulosiruptor bescii]PBC90333.1 type I restriction modification DNA specificity protein [Caldicellulosiruptor bescii]PBD06130.1 type I restriction modification DNA specificity protein [Caldicellulosiruptor bescii]PBD08870.1 type I restriction modification DNA specificity protein [Caldicellulosiruptor bescii]PFH17973.1 type I restriction modification DNA 